MHDRLRRLTFVTDAPHFGGAERYITAMARAAVARGIEPRIWWAPARAAEADVFTEIHSDGIPVILAEGSAGFRARLDAFTRMVRHERPNALIFNATGRRGFWQLPWVVRSYGIPSVWVHHMVDGQDPRRLPPRRLGGRIEGPGLWRVPQVLRHRLAAAAASAVVTLNEQDRQHVIRWHRVARHKVHVIPNGIDTTRFRFSPDARRRMRQAWAVTDERYRVVGTAARLVKGKGIECLIEAIASLRRQGTSAILVVAGTGPDREHMVAMAHRLHVSDHVRFLGFVADMPAFYSGLDVFALCSTTESFGLVLAEAMACARPVVATPTAGAARQIQTGHNGRLLKTFSSRELTHVLETMLRTTGASEAEAMGRAGRETVVRCFSIDLALERTLGLLRRPKGHGPPYPSPAGLSDAILSPALEELG